MDPRRLALKRLIDLEDMIRRSSGTSVTGFVTGERGWRDLLVLTTRAAGDVNSLVGDSWSAEQIGASIFDACERGVASRSDEYTFERFGDGVARDFIDDAVSRVTSDYPSGDRRANFEAGDVVPREIMRERFEMRMGTTSDFLQVKERDVFMPTIKETLLRCRADVDYAGVVQMELLRGRVERAGSPNAECGELVLPTGGADAFEEKWLTQHWERKIERLGCVLEFGQRGKGNQVSQEVWEERVVRAIPEVAAGLDTWGFASREMRLRPENWSELELGPGVAVGKVDLGAGKFQVAAPLAVRGASGDLLVEVDVPSGNLPGDVVKRCYESIDTIAIELDRGLNIARMENAAAPTMGQVAVRFVGAAPARVKQQLSRDLERSAGLHATVGQHVSSPGDASHAVRLADKKFALTAVAVAKSGAAASSGGISL